MKIRVIHLTEAELKVCIEALEYARNLLSNQVCDDLEVALSEQEETEIQGLLLAEGITDSIEGRLTNKLILLHLKARLEGSGA